VTFVYIVSVIARPLLPPKFQRSGLTCSRGQPKFIKQ